ncbi:hypothetical protein SAMN05192579_10295 [Rhodanobacter glycinis]|uniref:Uncharacterized protein n=1 Tax=Rhodanobacter glycinis TaxID=582702 RepID=A0A1I3YXS6_9GAMM|nr:hypothetical protein SAMN05192579_10295 [Rhodanobacter glycinis]
MSFCGSVGCDHGAQGATVQHYSVARTCSLGSLGCLRGEHHDFVQMMRCARGAILPRVGDGQNGNAMSDECREQVPYVRRDVAMLAGKEDDAAHLRCSVAPNQNGIAVITADAQEQRCRCLCGEGNVWQYQRFNPESKKACSCNEVEEHECCNREQGRADLHEVAGTWHLDKTAGISVGAHPVRDAFYRHLKQEHRAQGALLQQPRGINPPGRTPPSGNGFPVRRCAPGGRRRRRVLPVPGSRGRRSGPPGAASPGSPLR